MDIPEHYDETKNGTQNKGYTMKNDAPSTCFFVKNCIQISIFFLYSRYGIKIVQRPYMRKNAKSISPITKTEVFSQQVAIDKKEWWSCCEFALLFWLLLRLGQKFWEIKAKVKYQRWFKSNRPPTQPEGDSFELSLYL